MEASNEELVHQAKGGDKNALEKLVQRIQNQIYNLEIKPAAFRKRLSRARTRLRNFMSKNCALINPANPCKCENQADRQIEIGFLDNQNLAFATHPCRIKQDRSVQSRLQELNELNRVSTLFKSYIDVEAPDVFVENIRGILTSGQYEIFEI